MRLVFIGTPDFAIPTLSQLIKTHNVTTVITQPDRPRGRHLHPTPSPVKELSIANNIPLLQPESLRDNPEFEAELRQINPDAIVVAAYGKIIPKWLIELPELGCINLHASLLPAYRGAAPIQRAIFDGKKKTGVTSMLMDEGLDTGDILLAEEIAIEPGDDYGSLTDKLAITGARLIIKTLSDLTDKNILPTAQDDRLATYAEKISKEDQLIDWRDEAASVNNKVRALSPKPGAYSFYKKMRVKIFSTEAATTGGYQGEVLEADDKLIVAAGKSSLIINEIQPEGKRAMSGEAFIRGYHIGVGDRFGG